MKYTIDLRPKSYVTLEKKRNFIKKAAALLSMYLIFMIFIWINISNKNVNLQEQLDLLETDKISQISKKQEKIYALEIEENYRTHKSIVENLNNKRVNWYEILTELDTVKPDGLVISNLSGSDLSNIHLTGVADNSSKILIFKKRLNDIGFSEYFILKRVYFRSGEFHFDINTKSS